MTTEPPPSRQLPSRIVALVIATRGNSQTLLKTIGENLRGAHLPSTRIVLGMDDDDPDLEGARATAMAHGSRVRAVIGPRPGSLGAVYNRCVEQEPADLYITGADDAIIRTPGWDVRILQETEKMPEFVGVVGFGKMPVESMLPAMYAVTRPLIDRMGFFLQPVHAVLVDRHLAVRDIGDDRPPLFSRSRCRVRRLEEDAGHARSDLLGGVLRRYAVAPPGSRRKNHQRSGVRVNRQSKRLLLARMDDLATRFRSSNSCLRDPAYAEQIMKKFAHDAAPDDRYNQIKARSMAMIKDRQAQ